MIYPTYLINPIPQDKRPYVWSIRSNWNVEDGFWYDTDTGAVYYLTSQPYVSYIGRIPVKQPIQMEIV